MHPPHLGLPTASPNSLHTSMILGEIMALILTIEAMGVSSSCLALCRLFSNCILKGTQPSSWL